MSQLVDGYLRLVARRAPGGPKAEPGVAPGSGGAALISYTAGFGTGSYPAFRMSLVEKPTVSQTAPLHLTISSYTCAVQAAGTQRGHPSAPR